MVLASGPVIEPGDLPSQIRPAPAAETPAESDGDRPGRFKEAKQQLIEKFERQFIADALARHRGNISKAAEDMGMYRQHLQLKLAEYGIDAEAYRHRG
jgi:DNA-binding NtrC family response regulator